MNLLTKRLFPLLGLFFLILPVTAQEAAAQEENKVTAPDSRDFRDVIHGLFADHEKVFRTVELTSEGYRSTTVSSDPEVTASLRLHIQQMQSRLEGGMGVRMWDPAFVELVAHYEDMDFEVRDIAGGVSVEVKGKTPAAVLVTQNHATIVSGFAEKGATQMHATHPEALAAPVVPSLDGETSLKVPLVGEESCGKGDKPCCADRQTKTEEKSCCMDGKVSAEK